MSTAPSWAARRRIALVALGMWACARGLPASDSHPLLNVIPSPPRLSAPTMDGSFVTLPLPDRVTVIDVWDTSCEPCAKLMPKLEALARRTSPRVAVIGVALDDNPGLVQQVLRGRNISYPNVVDTDWRLKAWLHVDRIPTTVVFDEAGRVRWVHVGRLDEDGTLVERVVDHLLSGET